MEDISPLEPALDLKFEDLPPPADVPGLVKISLHSATTDQLQELKRAIEDHPGEFLVYLNIFPVGQFPSVVPNVGVDPDAFLPELALMPFKLDVHVERRDAVGA